MLLHTLRNVCFMLLENSRGQQFYRILTICKCSILQFTAFKAMRQERMKERKKERSNSRKEQNRKEQSVSECALKCKSSTNSETKQGGKGVGRSGRRIALKQRLRTRCYLLRCKSSLFIMKGCVLLIFQQNHRSANLALQSNDLQQFH